MKDADFEELENEEAQEVKGALVLVEKTEEPKNKMEEIIDEADEKNKKAIIEDLQELGADINNLIQREEEKIKNAK